MALPRETQEHVRQFFEAFESSNIAESTRTLKVLVTQINEQQKATRKAFDSLSVQLELPLQQLSRAAERIGKIAPLIDSKFFEQLNTATAAINRVSLTFAQFPRISFGPFPDAQEMLLGFGAGSTAELATQAASILDAFDLDADSANDGEVPERSAEAIFEKSRLVIPEETRIRLADAGSELIERCRRAPEEMYQLPPRDFERLIATIFENFGFQVDLGPVGRDGGVDVFARLTRGVPLLVIIQCKRYARHRPVGVDVVRSLHGVLDVWKAHMGVVATTSHFTRGVNDQFGALTHRMQLADYQRLKDWLAGSNLLTR